MAASWVREGKADLAVQKILDGAARAFVDLGVSQAGMNEIARYAGCSRGTLYRYFGSRHELHLAFVSDRAMRLVAELQVELQAIEDPSEQLTAYILGAIRKVRENPSMSAWFEPAESGIAARMSRGSEVIASLAGAFESNIESQATSLAASGMRARWVVRVIVSLLTMPGESEEEERLAVEHFVVPLFMTRPGREPAFPGALRGNRLPGFRSR